MRLHRIILSLLYILTLISAVYLYWEGGDYYFLPETERPHHQLHTDWKPGRVIGHGLGIIGSLLMLVLFLYSVRKRFRFMGTWGNIRYWLNYHIWMGITGPLLVIFHTTFKINGIIAISFWSMIAVALSGVLGRYVYLQIPRSLSGDELSPDEINRDETKLLHQLKEEYGVTSDTIQSIIKLVGIGESERSVGWSIIGRWIVSDLTLPFALSRIKRTLCDKDGRDTSEIAQIIKLARRLAILKRRIAFLKQAQSILHYWHIIHKPFAIVMIVIMVIHVVVAVLFGYKWIF